MQQYLKNGDQLPDETQMRLLKDRLEESDCKQRGWVVVGAPTNLEQLNFIKEMYTQPSHYISFEMSDNLIYEKLE